MDNIKLCENKFPNSKIPWFPNEPQGSLRETLPTLATLEVNVSPRERILSYECTSQPSNIKLIPYMLVA